jgi:transcriptional regulator with XRE-family HTH domain
MEPFAALLQLFQERWPAQRAIAREAGIDHARYNRLVRGEVAPANREQVLAIARALRLNPLETDQFVAAAGYLPPSLTRGSIGDPALRAVLAVLGHTALSTDDREAFRRHVEQAAKWLLAADAQHKTRQ